MDSRLRGNNDIIEFCKADHHGSSFPHRRESMGRSLDTATTRSMTEESHPRHYARQSRNPVSAGEGPTDSRLRGNADIIEFCRADHVRDV